ncbi:MAG: PAAR domain-containing protein [Burkholderiales bacterium]|jgi:uncharacterized Zn-binding protein involved in type VI secretion|nr:PAAR domain-containing protein [Burkholderiales bacterium]
MSRHVIRVGDKTTTGGTVITGDPLASDQERPIARKGDMATCLLCRVGIGPIAEGQEGWELHGQPVALEGHVVACGCPWGTNRLVGSADASMVE